MSPNGTSVVIIAKVNKKSLFSFSYEARGVTYPFWYLRRVENDTVRMIIFISCGILIVGVLCIGLIASFFMKTKV